MDERQEILEAMQDGLETGEVFLTDIPEKNKDIFADPEMSEQFKRLAENLTGRASDDTAEVSCGDSSKAAAGGCAACGFKCSMAKLSSPSDIPGDDPFAERNPTKMDEPPLPETTFPMPQVLLAVTACIAGCYFAERIISSLLGR